MVNVVFVVSVVVHLLLCLVYKLSLIQVGRYICVEESIDAGRGSLVLSTISGVL